MNKYKFIDYLHHPKKVTKEQEAKLLEVVEDFPYFQTARTLVAKVKSEQKDPSSKKYVASASLYVFDRTFLRKYISEDLFIIEPKAASAVREKEAEKTPELARKSRKTPTQSKEASRTESKSAGKNITTDPKLVASKDLPSKEITPTTKKEITKSGAQATSPKPPPSLTDKSQKENVTAVAKKQIDTREAKSEAADTSTSSDAPLAAPDVTSNPSLDKLIEEVYQDMADLRKSKARFIEWQEKNDMEEAVEKAMAAAADEVKSPNPDSTPKEEEKAQEETPEPTKSQSKKDVKSVESQEVEDQTVTKESEEVSAATAVKAADVKEKDNELVAANESIEDTPKKKETPKESTTEKKAAAKPAPKAATKKDTVSKTASAKSKAKTPTKKSSTTRSTTKKSSTTAKKTTTKPTASKSDTKTPVKKNASPKSSSDDAGSKKTTEKQKPPTKKEKGEKEEIIDKFIETQPSISKPVSGETTSKDDLSKKSTRFHADIASEYLAEIYIEQGKNQRAIEIYENLCLKFPEKKSYFAGLIEKLKKE